MRSVFCVAFLSLLLWGCAQPINPEVEAVKQVINKAYVEGIHNNGSIDDIKAGFDPSFEMLSNTNGELTRFAIADWIERIESNRANNPDQKRERTDVKFLDIDITGGTASVKFELLRGEKTIFTDYMYLYKFDDGWRIVCKVYHRH